VTLLQAMVEYHWFDLPLFTLIHFELVGLRRIDPGVFQGSVFKERLGLYKATTRLEKRVPSGLDC
jgi:hypothetical protein